MTRSSYTKGLRAEWVSLWLLRLRGYRLVARRYKTPGGEIDLLMRWRRTLVAVEVKHRPSVREAAEALTSHQQKRLVKALLFFLTRNPGYGSYDLRFDLMIVVPWTWPLHLKNVLPSCPVSV